MELEDMIRITESSDMIGQLGLGGCWWKGRNFGDFGLVVAVAVAVAGAILDTAGRIGLVLLSKDCVETQWWVNYYLILF